MEICKCHEYAVLFADPRIMKLRAEAALELSFARVQTHSNSFMTCWWLQNYQCRPEDVSAFHSEFSKLLVLNNSQDRIVFNLFLARRTGYEQSIQNAYAKSPYSLGSSARGGMCDKTSKKKVCFD
ncbi:Uncharacterized protein Adt_02703 [Abeliophyllum distichum]|uniref:Uncharacterized protein n=1 Tax=Abeliophyllum distichum TaxID=126358 RepID=A0ABD1VWE2_9LAMI